jgi:hypothetical protein
LSKLNNNELSISLPEKLFYGVYVPQRQAQAQREVIMTIEYDEKGKIFTDIVSKTAVHATIQTTMQMMRGRIHVRRDQRMIDELNVNENFIAITDVSVLGADGQTLFQVPFLAVCRSQIVWIIPEPEPGEEN